MVVHVFQENKGLKQKLSEQTQTQSQNEDNNEVIQELRMNLEDMKEVKNKEVDEIKLQHEHALKEITKKCEIIEQRLQESNDKCEQFQQQISNDKQSMITISNQHKQVWLFDIIEFTLFDNVCDVL